MAATVNDRRYASAAVLFDAVKLEHRAALFVRNEELIERTRVKAHDMLDALLDAEASVMEDIAARTGK